MGNFTGGATETHEGGCYFPIAISRVRRL